MLPESLLTLENCPATSIKEEAVTSRRQGRFTRDGDEALEEWLGQLCAETAVGVAQIVPANRLEALILGGGYGRGEGGVLTTSGGDAPYNDLEFFVLIKGAPRLNERRYGKAIHDLGHRLTDESGFEVELKITSLDTIRSSETTMFYYDLVCGHRVTLGPPDILECCDHHAQPERIPMHEATRLLMNRCSGLLYAQERLERTSFTDEDADFVFRNIAKARLALGDALLAAKYQFHWSCIERNRRLKLLDLQALAAEMPFIIEGHAAGVQFKLHPQRSTADKPELQELHQIVKRLGWRIWQWTEQKRLASSIDSPMQYALDKGSKCPETKPLKNALVRALAFGPAAVTSSDRWRYPRESLLRILPVLLWQSDDYSADAAALAERWLRTPTPSWKDAVAAYEGLWCRYN